MKNSLNIVELNTRWLAFAGICTALLGAASFSYNMGFLLPIEPSLIGKLTIQDIFFDSWGHFILGLLCGVIGLIWSYDGIRDKKRLKIDESHIFIRSLWKSEEYLALGTLLLILALFSLYFGAGLAQSRYFKQSDFLPSLMILAFALFTVTISRISYFADLIDFVGIVGAMCLIGGIVFSMLAFSQASSEILVKATENNKDQIMISGKRFKLLKEYSKFKLLYSVDENQIFTISTDALGSSLQLIR